jgi:SNF2 family DNA or RNA helicase
MPYKARVTANNRIALIGPYLSEWVEFCRSLPDARWDKKEQRWTCMATDFAAMRIMAWPDGIDMEQPILDAAMRTMGAVLNAKHVQGADAATGLHQPVSRTISWKHQKVGFASAKDFSAAMLAYDMGTGKSKVAVDLTHYWDAKWVLVLCPKSVLGVWRREFARHAALQCDVVVLSKGTVKNKRDAAALAIMTPRGLKQLVLVINYESAKAEPFEPWSLAIEWDLVICDESQKIKSHSSAASKYAARLGRKARRRLCLTGTPMGQSPLDLFGQFRFLDPGIYGTNWSEFSNRYALHQNKSVPQMVTGYKNQEELKQRMAWITYRCLAADVLDLPEVHHIDQVFELEPGSKKKYDGMEEELIAAVGDGVATASNALVKMLKCQQITSGFLMADDSDKITEFGHEKIETLEDILDGLDPREPVVVFCRFKHDLARVQELAKVMKRRYGELSGDRHDALNENACMSHDIDVAGIQIQAGGIGIDLTRARYAVYYSLGFSLTEYDQSIARLHRPGQTRPVTYYHLVAEGTIDRYVYKAMQEKREIIDEILSVFRRA